MSSDSNPGFSKTRPFVEGNQNYRLTSSNWKQKYAERNRTNDLQTVLDESHSSKTMECDVQGVRIWMRENNRILSCRSAEKRSHQCFCNLEFWRLWEIFGSVLSGYLCGFLSIWSTRARSRWSVNSISLEGIRIDRWEYENQSMSRTRKWSNLK